MNNVNSLFDIIHNKSPLSVLHCLQHLGLQSKGIVWAKRPRNALAFIIPSQPIHTIALFRMLAISCVDASPFTTMAFFLFVALIMLSLGLLFRFLP